MFKKIIFFKLFICHPSKHALFYFRKDNYLDKLTHAQKGIYTNECDVNPAESERKLNEFKKELKLLFRLYLL